MEGAVTKLEAEVAGGVARISSQLVAAAVAAEGEKAGQAAVTDPLPGAIQGLGRVSPGDVQVGGSGEDALGEDRVGVDDSDRGEHELLHAAGGSPPTFSSTTLRGAGATTQPAVFLRDSTAQKQHQQRPPPRSLPPSLADRTGAAAGSSSHSRFPAGSRASRGAAHKQLLQFSAKLWKRLRN